MCRRLHACTREGSIGRRTACIAHNGNVPLTLPAADGLKCTVTVMPCVGDSVTGVPAPLKE